MIHRQRQLNQPSNLNDIARYLHQFGEQFKQTTQQFLDELAEERKRRGDLAAFTAALDKMSKDMLAAATSIYQTNTSLTTTLQDILVPVTLHNYTSNYRDLICISSLFLLKHLQNVIPLTF